MLLKSKSSFKIARRHMKLFRFLPALLLCFALIFASLFISQDSSIRTSISEFTSDTSILFLSLIEKPFSDLKGYQENFKRHRYLQENAYKLKEILPQLRALKNKAHSLEIRNKELRYLLSLQGTSKKSFLTAPCFGKNSFVKSQTLYVHAGRKNGVKRFNVVLSEDAIVGQVDYVGGKTSRILLITDPLSHIPVECEQSHQEGVLYGNEDGELSMLFVQDPKKIQIGEHLFSSGVDKYFPRGKLIGTVSRITDKRVFVTPIVDFNNLHYVQIQKSHKGESE